MGLFDLFSNSDAEQAAQQANAGVQAGYGQLSDLYSQGNNALTTNYGNASSLYAPLVASTGAGATAYGNASGANGTAGLKQAMSDFQNSGQYGNYGFSLTQGLQALDRTHAAAGNLNSGNADTDTLNYATGLANNTYNSYLSGLQPYLGANASAVSGAAGIDTGLGNALNANDIAQGNAANTAQTTMGNNTAGATLNNYKVGSNILGAITGIGGLIGGTGGLAKGLSGLFSGFGSSNTGTGDGSWYGPSSLNGAPLS